MGLLSKLSGKAPASHVRSWQRVGPAIVAQPQQALAALLGHAPAQQALKAAKLQAPDWASFRKDPSLDRDPHGLGLPADLLEAELFVRCMALWGPGALERAAFACAELQVTRQTRCTPARRPLRDAAFDAARAHLAVPSEATRSAAKEAAAACNALWEKRHGRNPDTDAARACWCELGAPWFAAETVADAKDFTEWDGEPPRAASLTWGNRHAVWPARATDAAAEWCSMAEVQAAMQQALLAWALADSTRPEDSE